MAKSLIRPLTRAEAIPGTVPTDEATTALVHAWEALRRDEARALGQFGGGSREYDAAWKATEGAWKALADHTRELWLTAPGWREVNGWQYGLRKGLGGLELKRRPAKGQRP
jgi:hypothetical protein